MSHNCVVTYLATILIIKQNASGSLNLVTVLIISQHCNGSITFTSGCVKKKAFRRV